MIGCLVNSHLERLHCMVAGALRQLSFAVVLLVFGANVLWGQSSTDLVYRDSLLATLKQTEEKKTRLELLAKLIGYYQERGGDSVAFYQKELLETGTQSKDTWLGAYTWKLLGDSHLSVNDLPAAQRALEQSHQMLIACSSPNCIALRLEVVLDLNYAYQRQGIHRESISLLKQYLDEGALDALNRSLFLLRIGESLNEVGDYDAALSYLNEGLQLSRDLGNEDREEGILSIIGITHYYLGRVDKAISFFKESLLISRRLGNTDAECYTLYIIGNSYSGTAEIDSSWYYLSLLREVALKNKDESYYGFAVGGLFHLAAEYGLPQLDRCKAEAEAILDGDYHFAQLHVKRNIYHSLSRYHLKEGNHQLAESYALEHLAHVSQYQADTTELITFALHELSKVQAEIGNYKEAWKNLDRYHGIRVAMINRNREDALARTAVEMELTENELARQQAEQAAALEQQNSAARTRLFLTLLAVVAVVLLMVFWAYRRAQTARRIIGEKNAQIEQSLAEKEVLLREIHHRVKNNLQIISSLLDKQARKSTDEAVRQLVREGQERIQSMALIHQNLYESDQLSGIDIKSYLLELSQNIQRSHAGATDQVKLELNVAEAKLDIDTAIPVGLILNELITNCYKYAFVDRDSGKISVDFNKTGENYLLRVSDDGVGFKPEEVKSRRTLGMNLINGLVRQLEGTIEWLAVENGSAVAITFS